MVNINQINELTQALGGTNVSTPKTEKTGIFDNALTQALGQAGQTEPTKETEPPGMGITMATALGEIPSNGIEIEDQSSIVSGKTDMLLGLLDDYSSKLENPGVSLKSIAPVLEKINQNADSLLKESISLGSANQELKDIATQTVIAARTEYVRFQRGDYLS
jgi:hypothetical protein